MNSSKQFEPDLVLLQKSTSADVGLLISDIELVEEGYTINYIIDPMDVIEYSFPYGIKFNKDKELDTIGDEMIAYSYVFKNSSVFNNSSPIILDEYLIELHLIRNKIRERLPVEIKKNLFQKLLSQLEEDKNDKKKINSIYKELSQSASFLLSTVLMTDSFVSHFNDLYSNKLQISNFRLKSGNKQDERIILESFKNNRRSDWSENAFREWVLQKQNDFKDKKKPKVFREYQNTYRDYVVIDRICTINKDLLNNNNLSSKQLFLYFSSAEKSEEIFASGVTRQHLPKVNGISNYNILRSAKHSYLLFLFDDKDTAKIKNALTRVKELKISKERGDLINDKDDEEIRKKYRDILENSSIANQINKHDAYQESLRKMILELESNRNYPEKLAEIYKNLLAEAEKTTENIGLLEIGMTYSLQSSLKNLVELLLNEKLNLHKGNDAVVGIYHHLPILLFYDNSELEVNNLKNLLLKVIDYVIKPPAIRSGNIEEFIKVIRELYNKSEDFKEADVNYSSILIKSLLYLILPNKNTVQQENDAYYFVRDAFTRLKYESEEYSKWNCEYLYFLIWASRRDDAIETSLNLAEDAICENPNEPRFHHGRSLALYNKFTNLSNLEIGNLDDLEFMLHSAERAVFLYEAKIDTGTYRDGYDKFIKGSIFALQNLILYCVSLFYLTKLENGEQLSFEPDSIFFKYTLANL